MLIKAKLKHVKEYGDFVYSLALNQCISSYPTYTDGIKTKEDFISAAEKAVADENAELLLYEMYGSVEGWIHFFWIPEEKYLQLSCFCVRKGNLFAMMELLDSLEEAFEGYDFYFGFPQSNVEATTVLKTAGFDCIEQDWNYTFFFEKYMPLAEDSNVRRICKENYADFKAVYQPDENTFWNCERILEKLDEWFIYCYYQEDVPVAASFFRGKDGYYEIYGMEYLGAQFQEEMCRALLVAVLNQCKSIGADYMTFFCDEDTQKIVEELGFHCVGEYVLYYKNM